MDVLFLLVALVVILFGAELFTNGIEWFGHKLKLAEGAVGSVLAAVGTALPETMIPMVAILVPTAGAAVQDSHEIGVGAILGAPFMLSTLAMFVTGAAVLAQARRRPRGDRMPVDTGVLGKDIRYFLMTYGIAVAAAFLPADAAWSGPVRVGAAVLLVVLYALYVRAHFVGEAGVESTEDVEVDLAPLRFHRVDVTGYRQDPHAPRLRVVVGQVLVSLGLILIGAVVFVDAVEHLATQLRVAPAILALVVAPIATELPEKFNSIIWIRQGKDTLALGNITGAMVFQSCIPVVVALLFAAESWAISSASIVTFASAGIAFVSTAVIFVPMMTRGILTGRSLLLGGVFYALYLALVGASVAGWLSGILGPDAH